MQTLVTGGAGFIGSNIARALLDRGDDVRVFDNLLTGFREAIPEGAEFVQADLRDLDAITAACEGVDVVFHQAALRSVPRSVDDPLLSLECNVLGTMNVLRAAHMAGVRRLVYASSSSVYGDTNGAMTVETIPTDPRSPYAVSKLAGEHYCRTWTHLGYLSTVSLRYFNVYGPGQRLDSKYATVFPGFISALMKKEPPLVHWDGEQSRDFSFITDVVRANLQAAERPEVDGEVFNIGGGGGKTINQVLGSISTALGTWIDPVRAPKRAGDVRHTKADISKAERLLGWKPEAEWDMAVASTVAWFKLGSSI